MVFHDSTKNNLSFSNHQSKAELKNLDDSEVLNSDFPGLKTSTASMTSIASTTSMASWPRQPHFIKKLTDPDFGSFLAPK